MRSILTPAVALLLASASSSLSQQQQQAPRDRAIEYSSVEEALATLRARRDVKISEQGGWTVVQDVQDDLTMWSFTPSNHPAYPAVVKRTFFQDQSGAWHVDMRVKCRGTKANCDKLVADFRALNEQMRQAIERDHRSRAPR
jgi:hypothetical protein